MQFIKGRDTLDFLDCSWTVLLYMDPITQSINNDGVVLDWSSVWRLNGHILADARAWVGEGSLVAQRQRLKEEGVAEQGQVQD